MKVTYYREGKLNVKKTILSHAGYYLERAINRLDASIMSDKMIG